MVSQTSVTDILVEVLSLSFHYGTQTRQEWLLDATALLCGLTPLSSSATVLSQPEQPLTRHCSVVPSVRGIVMTPKRYSKGTSGFTHHLCVFWAFVDCFHLEVQNKEREREAGGGEGKSQADELCRETLPVVSPPEPLSPLFTPSSQLPPNLQSWTLLQRPLQWTPGPQMALLAGEALRGPGAGEVPAASRLPCDQGQGGTLAVQGRRQL